MKKYNMRCLLRSVPLVCALGLSMLRGANSPEFVPSTSESVRQEYKRITETYKDDIPRMTEELQKFSRTVARAAGVEDELARSQALLEKYGPASNITRVTRIHGGAGDIIDNSAWRSELAYESGTIVIIFHLDKVRYKDSYAAKDLKVEIRRKGRTDQEEMLLTSGGETDYSFRARLLTEQRNGGVYAVSVVVPEKERRDYVVQVNANIEPGWSTLARISLERN